MKLNVTIDRNCQGHGICYSVSPELFEPDDEGYGTVKHPTIEDGSNLAEHARHAQLGCPERAIHIDEA